MANYRAVSAGNWSQLARWEDDSGGSYAASSALPGVNDVVYSNSYVVNIDIDIAVDGLDNNAATGVSINGYFIINDGITAICDIYSNNTTNYYCVLQSHGGTSYHIGMVYGPTGGNTTAGIRQSAGTLIRTGNDIARSNASNVSGHYSAVYVQGGNYVLNGNSLGSSATGAGLTSVGTTCIGGIVTINGSAIPNVAPGVRIQAGSCYINTLVGAGVSYTSGNYTITHNITSMGALRYTADGSILVYLPDGSSLTLTAAPNYPAASDVKAGVSYGPSGIYTGTWNIPITAEDLLAAIEVSTNPIAERIRNCATVASTGAQLTAFKNN